MANNKNRINLVGERHPLQDLKSFWEYSHIN
jgi:hypothetical protein